MGRVKELLLNEEFKFVNQIEKPQYPYDFYDIGLEQRFNIKIK